MKEPVGELRSAPMPITWKTNPRVSLFSCFAGVAGGMDNCVRNRSTPARRIARRTCHAVSPGQTDRSRPRPDESATGRASLLKTLDNGRLLWAMYKTQFRIRRFPASRNTVKFRDGPAAVIGDGDLP
ncbi:hypothetical protein Sfum_2457 [Syntrophobacter fumaroxidans MPOB]|uniref:Uncharacterized protein n=1 Tax=Syntrophobacter fumaroxidans (strain DSM 10017 / MPOB) TaxID=335543 RepID=A0LL35_SYNFM|nr:hypothetical protein Sfum_2457 [Syntrophobacter fumaroxidans MPOB]